MKKIILLAALAAVVLTGCKSVPISGRKQLSLVDDSQVLASSLTSYKSYMSTAAVSKNATQSAQVTRVGRKIAAATEAYLKANGLSSEVANFAWEFNLVKDQELNAFCMPGGKIVVYEGMANFVQSDDELAVILGHEVAHAVAKHSNERMSQQLLAQYGAQALSALTKNASYNTQAIAGKVYGLGANYGVMLPFSRKHETEADEMGLVLMAMAGYNPEVAVDLWTRMGQNSTSRVPEFMSSHPSDSKRAANIKKKLPEIHKKYGQYYLSTSKSSTGGSSSYSNPYGAPGTVKSKNVKQNTKKTTTKTSTKTSTKTKTKSTNKKKGVTDIIG